MFEINNIVMSTVDSDNGEMFKVLRIFKNENNYDMCTLKSISSDKVFTFSHHFLKDFFRKVYPQYNRLWSDLNV